MTDPLFRTPAEKTAHDTILAELRARVPSF